MGLSAVPSSTPPFERSARRPGETVPCGGDCDATSSGSISVALGGGVPLNLVDSGARGGGVEGEGVVDSAPDTGNRLGVAAFGGVMAPDLSPLPAAKHLYPSSAVVVRPGVSGDAK